MIRRNKSIENSADKKSGKLLWKNQQKTCNFIHEITVVTFPVIASFAGTTKKNCNSQTPRTTLEVITVDLIFMLIVPLSH